MGGFLNLIFNTLLYTTSNQDKPPLLLPSLDDVIRLEGQSWNEKPLIQYSEGLIFSVDFHWEKQYVYWTKFPEGNLYRTKLTSNGNATTIETVITTDSHSFYMFAVDWVQDKIYWLEWSETEKLYLLRVANLDGSMTKTLAKIKLSVALLSGIHLDPYKKYIYFTTMNGIERIRMDGVNREIIRSMFVWTVMHIDIDFKNDRLYYHDKLTFTLNSCKTDGTDIKVEMSNLYHCNQIHVYQDSVYWLTKKYDLDKLVRYNRLTGSVTELEGYADLIKDYKIYHPYAQIPGSNPCSVNNGGCSHLCLPVANHTNSATYTCECPDGYNKQDTTWCIKN